MCLSVGEFTGVLNIGQVLVVGDDGDRVRCSLNILSPFRKGKDNSEEFAIVDVVIPFSREEGTRKVGTGVKISISICLKQNGACCEQRGVSHDRERMSNIWDG